MSQRRFDPQPGDKVAEVCNNNFDENYAAIAVNAAAIITSGVTTNTINTQSEKIMQLSNISLITNTFGTSKINAIDSDKLGNILIGGASTTGIAPKAAISANYGYTIASITTNPFTINTNMTAVKFSTITAGLCVAATDAGEIAVSVNYGVDFTLITSPFNTQINAIDCDASGIFHFVGITGKYAKTTTAAATVMSALIDVGATTYILDNVVCITGGIVMISGHSAKLFRSTANGDVGSWSAIANPFLIGDLDALWCIGWDGANRVVIGCYDSNVPSKKGNIAISDDKGITFGSLISTAFSTLATPQRMIRFKYFDGQWIGVGDAGTIQRSFNLSSFSLIKGNPFLGGIVYEITDIGGSYVMPGATGRLGRTLFIQ